MEGNCSDWKGFQIKCIQTNDYSAVLSHLRETFYKDEPVNKWFGMNVDRIADYDQRMLDIMSRYEKNLMAVSKENDQIAEVLLINFHSKDNSLPNFTPRSAITTRFSDFLEKLEECFNIHEKYRVSTFPELAILSIDKNFRGHGLATELYKRAIDNLFLESTDKVPLLYSEFSNPASRKIGEALGFKEVARYYFKEYEEMSIEQRKTLDEKAFVSITVMERPNGESEGVPKHLQDWNNFGFKLITKADYPKVFAHLQEHFYKDEPFNRALGLTPERIADKDELIRNILDINLNHGSFYAYPKDDHSKVAGVLIIWYHEKGKELPDYEPRSPLTAMVRVAVAEIGERYNYFEENKVNIYPEIYIISTDKEYRGKGLASEMYRKAINKFKSEGEKFVASCFTNPFSLRIGEKFGFKQVSRLDAEECKKPDGSSLLGEAGVGQCAINTILLL